MVNPEVAKAVRPIFHAFGSHGDVIGAVLTAVSGMGSEAVKTVLTEVVGRIVIAFIGE